MKRSFYLLLSIVAVSLFGISSMTIAGPHKAEPKPSASAAAAATKITKEEAKRVVLFANTGSHIEGCELVKGKDHPNWAVSVTKAGASSAATIEVDGMTGKILTVDAPTQIRP